MHKKQATIPRKFFSDLDIFTDGQYDKDKIEKIDIEKINFTYDNAVARMQQIDDDIKIIGTRSTWLLGLLTIIVLAFANLLFRNLNFLPEQDIGIIALLIKIVIVTIPFFCLTIIAIYTRRLIAPNFGIPAHNEPENLMTRETFQHDIKLIKILEIETLQDRINANVDRFSKLARIFNRLILFFFALGFYAFMFTYGWAIITWFPSDSEFINLLKNFFPFPK